MYSEKLRTTGPPEKWRLPSSGSADIHIGGISSLGPPPGDDTAAHE